MKTIVHNRNEMINIDNSDYVGVVELEVRGEYHTFEVVKTDKYIVFGGMCNTGLLQSGYLEIDDCFSFDENLQELVADLETYYQDGKEYTALIVCNERM